jgi:hypothetical protein
MRASPCDAVVVGLLEQEHVLWLLAKLVVPPVPFSGLQTHRLTDLLEPSVWSQDEISYWDSRGISNPERVLVNGLDWTPSLR